MDLNRIMLDVFRIAGLVLLFVLAIGIFLSIAGYVMVGGEAVKTCDLSVCKVALANCLNMRVTGGANCVQTCLPCTGVLYEKCLNGDISLFP